MRSILPNVYQIEGLRVSNVYLLAAEAGLVLIDAGLTNAPQVIAAQVAAGGLSLSDVRTIVVTHAHGDHIGGLPELVARTGAQVLAHRDEVAFAERTQSLPARSLLQRLMGLMQGRGAGPFPPVKVSRALVEGDVVEALGGLRVMHVPGHTPGSICLYQAEQRLLFCGDIVVPKRLAGGQVGLDYGPAMFAVDAGEARRTVRRLADLPLEVLCPGHGDPVRQGAGAMLKALLEREMVL